MADSGLITAIGISNIAPKGIIPDSVIYDNRNLCFPA